MFTSAEARQWLESEVLPQYVPRCRWFGGKARAPQRFEVKHTVPLGDARLLFVRVTYSNNDAETYLLPGKLSEADNASQNPGAIIARCGEQILFDAVHDAAFRDDILQLIAQRATVHDHGGKLVGIPGSMLEGLPALASRVLDVEQSNSSIVYGERIFLKLYRKLEEGINPDAEITRFLTERQHFPHVPPFAGSLEFHSHRGDPQVLGLALGLVPNDGDAWAFALRELATFYERVSVESGVGPKLIEEFLGSARELGERTAALHLALAADCTDPAFAPEPLTLHDQRELADDIRSSAGRVFTLLRARLGNGGEQRTLIETILSAEHDVLEHVRRIEAHPIEATKTRVHGDYHLGQVICTGRGFVIIDFEGEPLRTLPWRKAKRSPLRDVAGMLRSFHYAAHSALGQCGVSSSDLESWAERWSRSVGTAFLEAWRTASGGADFVPRDRDFDLLLKTFLLEKAIYEIGYEVNNRPEWLPIPARGLLALVKAS